MLTETEILAIIDTRIDLHLGRVAGTSPATEDSQRLRAWHQAAVMTLQGLRDEIVARQPAIASPIASPTASPTTKETTR